MTWILCINRATAVNNAAKTARANKAKTATSQRTAKVLLGELYADKEYLEKLLKDEGVLLRCIKY